MSIFTASKKDMFAHRCSLKPTTHASRADLTGFDDIEPTSIHSTCFKQQSLELRQSKTRFGLQKNTNDLQLNGDLGLSNIIYGKSSFWSGKSSKVLGEN